RAFDLAAGPLFRAVLLRVDAEDHVLLLSMHHIVSDGWSMGVFFRELSSLYGAYREGGESPLAEPAVQYADYAVWQREQLAGEVLDRQLSYWKEQLAGAPELLELPTDHPRPAVRTYQGATVPVEFSPELLERLQALGRSEGATLYMVLLGAFQVLLSRYGAGEDMVVGSPIAGRTRGEVEELIGFFVNILVLRTDLSGDPSFREVLRRVREVTLGAYENQEVPFEKLVTELQPERSLSHSPLFQVMFTLQNARDPVGGLPGLEVGGLGAAMGIAKFDLFLSVDATPQGLRGGLNYSTDLFERGTVERMIGHLERVLGQVAGDPARTLSRLELLGEAERSMVLEEWNRTERPYPRGVCVHELFAAQVRERPDAVAMVWGEEELTYRELDARANQLAHHLVRLGVGPDARVGVLLERSAELIVSILAVLKAGGAYVPLDPGYPAGRLRLMMRDSSVRVLLTRSHLPKVLEAGQLDVVHLDQAAAALASEPVEAPRDGATAENLAYIVYTSGSTGLPKGIMVGHRQVVQLVVETDYVRLCPGDRVAQASNASFDALTFEAWGALLNGATLVGIPQDVLLSPIALRRVLREQRVTTIFLTTALVNQLSHEVPDIFAPVREVLFGGQAVDADSVRRLMKAGRPRRLLHMYGPTETTTFCLYEEVEHVAEDALTVPLGHATGNQRIYLLDPALNPVPVGVPGEAYVGGGGVARGYLERPGLTAERFLPDPFSAEPGARMYGTGDRMRWRGERKLEFIGRLDEQAKIRGFRIEPAEVESALSAHPAVREARVVVREDRPGDRRLVAYVVGEVEAEEVRAFLRGSLPEYMVPAAVVALERLPLTPNGKVDRRALPVPEYGSAEDRYVAPRTPLEEVLAGIWAEVLRLERVGVGENFFELGGHSLLATRVVSRIRAVFGVELPLRALFEGPTTAEMAARVEEMRRADLPVLPPVVPVERTGALPLSFAQERLWFIDRLEPGSAVYNIPMAWRLGGALDGAALERSLSEIVRRHESLRTVFTEVDGSPVQVVAPFGGFALPVEDLSEWREADREAEVRRRAGEEAGRPFDLSAGPLFRAALLRLGAEDHVLLLSMHHVVSDGWSLGVFFRELSSLYAAYREGRESPLPELAVQYADYAVWQREQLEGEVLDRQLSYWKEQLSGAPELLELPTDRSRPTVRTYQGATVPVSFSPELLERLQALGRSEGATLYMTLLSAFQVLLSKYGGGEDIVVGSPVAGRTRREVEELIGFFVNTLVLRTDLSGDPSFRETLRRVRDVTLGAYENQEVPFERLVEELKPERSLSHSPVFQVMFTLQNAGGGGGGAPLPGLTVGGVGAQLESAKFDLSLTLGATAHGLRGGLNYSTDLFEPGTIERMVGHLERVLEQVASDADVRLSQLELLDEAERALVLEEWNRTAAEFPADRCIHELFEAQAARTPGAVAVAFEGDSLAYRDLNEAANRLAHHLIRRGVGPEVRVGICLERSLEMVIAIVAVLKAGGAYVPLDPGYPPERLAYMLEDSGVAVLLIQERLRGILPASTVPTLAVDAAWDLVARESAENLAPAVTPSNVAYVIYTSGSTGRPKGVMNQHRGVVNRLWWMQAEYGIGAGDVVLQKTPFSFDVSVWEFFWPLQQGATLVMARPDGHRDPLYLQEVIERRGVTTLHFVPSMLQPFVEAVEAGRCGSLRRVICSGEALPPALVRRFYDRFAGPVVLTNLYGPTEAAVDVSCWACAREDAADVVPIGRPVWNTRLYVLDAALKPVPVGVPGELYIGGVQVARGYLGRSAMTAERFVPDPFSAQGGARLYRTGDRARWRADGAIEYLGRLDFQVKVRGFRIELGEIEGVLRRSEGVVDCVVMARADAGEQRLVAYVVGGVDAGVLREHLRRELPDYMVPAVYVVLERLPLTANGKLDRKALPAPEGDANARRSYEAPRGEVEAALAEIWAEVLGVGQVGRWDHFFELGGHSLLAIKLIERMRRSGLYTDVRALFTAPVLAELAQAVGRVSSDIEVPANGIPEGCGAITPEMLTLVELSQPEIDRIVGLVPGGAANVQDIYPLAPLQEGIHFHHLLSQEGDPYLTPMVTEFDTRARLEQYLGALQAVIDRHDILRTAVAWEGLREPVQVVWRNAPLPVEEVELEAGDTPEQQLWRRYNPRHYRMDLTRAPLRRACIAEDRARGRWLLLMLMHHLTSDHESLEVQREEIAAHLLGRESELPAPLPFRNYVAQARLGVSREEHERFFHGMLGDVEEPTAPYGLLDVLGEGHGIGEARLPVAGDLGARLRRRARALGVSAASLCHLAWAQVLARLSGRRDVVFGTLLFGRMQGGEGVDRVMGLFINTLPVRIGVGEEGVEAAVRRTHVLLAELLRHEHASLPLAQRCSGVAAPAPLFTSLLNYRYSGATSRSKQAGPGQPGEGVREIGAQERTNYPVVLSVDDLGEGFALSAQVAAPADARQVCRMMHTALERLVEALEATPRRAVGSLDVLPEAECRMVVEEWNRTERPYPRDVCIHELFEAQVRERPGAAALVWGDESLTYRELDARANRLANHLVRLGVGPDARVGVLLERSAELIVSILAVLKAGGCYVPLDPGYPPERLRMMLADSSVRVLLSRGGLAGEVEAGGLAVVHLDQAADALAAEPAEAPRGGATAENLAYIVYTSGSTGKPKGVMVAHRHVVQLVVETDYVQIRPGDRIAQASNAAFDALTFETWGAFLNGATLVGIPLAVLLSPPALYRMLREERITTLYQTTALLNQLSREQPDIFAPLRDVLFGGQAVDADSVRRLLKAGGPERLLHMYGPTETTAWCSWEQVEHVAEDALTVSVGRATGNQRIYLLDAALNPVPVGVPGEAYVGGDGVVRGYLDRPGLTAERFLPDPFAVEPGARMYRTGDRLRWKADGRLEFIGRVDEQVKVRGFRIEPGEIEATLTAHADVHEARVIVREDEPGEQRLVAYIVGKAHADTLREHLRLSLPEYMVPSAFVALERIPLTPNGKLDVKALPAPELGPAEKYVAPRTPVEEVLAEIWAEVLRLERVGVRDSFFELGGHSLLAIRVVSRIREVFSVELPLRALFEGPTVAELAVPVEELRRAELPVLPPVVPVERTGALRLSFAQERLWFLDRLEPGSTTYNIFGARRLGGVLDETALERSFSEIVRRHESLRTTFREVNGSPVQVVAPFEGFSLAVEDLSGLSEADREAAVGRRAGEEARRPFDLSTGPLFRAALLRLGAEDRVLLLGMHHIVSDGWSMGVLFRELSSLYAAYREGRESPLPELPVQYADYAVWQREQLTGEVLDRQLAYWKERLAGVPELLELPTDHPRPAVQTYRGATVPVALSRELLERLQALARSEGATLYMTLLGAFQVLLSKYAGSEDVVVGSPIAGRARGEVEALIGFFLNTLALRTDLSGNPSFREVLGRVREATLGAYAHQEVPFEKLVAELQPERSLSHAPFFQVWFTLLNAEGGGGGVALPGLEVSGVGSELGTAQFDLSLILTATPQGLLGGLNYGTDLFERGTVERMLGHLERVLEQVAADADVRLSRLELLGEAERRQVVEEWNRTDAAYPADRCIHELFEAQAARAPGAVAVRFEGESLTYGELNERANRLAHSLVRLGVGPEVRVGLCLERSMEMVVAILAVLKAGGAYVPLDPGYPAERLAFTLSDAGVPVVLVQESVRAVLPAVDGVEIVSLDGLSEQLAAESAENPRSGATSESLAYVIYTSGSTGRPKGVLIAHRNVARLFAATEAGFGFGESDVWTLFHSYAFDFSVWELWGALLYGGRLVVVPWSVSRDPAAFRKLLARERVTVLSQTPSAFRALAEVDEGEAEPLQALRTVVFGGEALQYESLRGWLDRYGPRRPRLVNMYGITETTVHVTWHTVTGRELKDAAAGSGVGKAIPDLRAYVLDPAGNPSPLGVPGELYVGGAGLARGYLGRPGLTAQRFVPDPFSGEAGALLYRSGDRARWKADGTLEYLGRIDQQVKIRGFRIELGEIESVLLAHPGVASAAVIVRGEGRDTELVAYVVAAGRAPSPAELRDALKRHLPDYMVPAAFVPLERLPLTANGKLDRKALPAPEAAAAGAEDGYVAPRTPVEEVLAAIWCEVLRLERVGAEDDFFAVGGHSLRATQVAARVRDVFAIELPLRALFEAPVLADLAARVEEIRRAGVPVLPPVLPVDRTGPLPLSFAQERLWFIHRLEPGSAAYNMPVVRRLGGALDEPALERALGEIVWRHESLRTTFAEVDGTPVQVVAPFRGFALPVEDLSGLSEADREAAVRRRVQEEAQRAFDLSAGPLFRAALLRLGEEDHVLLLSMHHIVSDGWSTGVLFRELSILYQAYRDGGESPLPELPVQYGDHAVWQRRHLQGEALERQVAWWKERLAGAPELLELPTDHPRPAVQAYRGAYEPIRVGAELLERLQTLGRGEGATLFMVLTGAFQVLLSKYSGSEDLVVGTTIAGRTRGELEGLIGLFMNTLVLRTDLSGQPTFREVLRRVREMTLGAYEHQELPFERLVEELRPERSLGHSPLIQVLIELLALDGQGGGGGLPGLETRGLGAEVKTAKFDLTVGMAITPHGLAGGVIYNTDLFERGTVRALVEHLVRVLEQVSADPDQRISRLRLMSPSERDRVVGWNRTTARYPAERCIHQWIEVQAARTPDAPAVLFGEERMTFGELDARANRIARHLAGLGVGLETRVGVCLERGLDMMPAILGVMKAGGAYVPIDPSHPAERMSYVLEDSGVRVLLTQAGLRDRVPAAEGIAVVCLDGERARIEAESAAPLESGVTSENLCYVIYTSGSTGRPKGVAMHHRGVSNYIHWGIRHYGADAGSGAPVFSSMAVDLTITNLLPLFCGHPVHFLPEENAVEA
ncbi:MAG TPA: non-ribosomal peptide synthase/polyketide synthase, partial [Longimicrobium sp.]